MALYKSTSIGKISLGPVVVGWASKG